MNVAQTFYDKKLINKKFKKRSHQPAAKPFINEILTNKKTWEPVFLFLVNGHWPIKKTVRGITGSSQRRHLYFTMSSMASRFARHQLPHATTVKEVIEQESVFRRTPRGHYNRGKHPLWPEWCLRHVRPIRPCRASNGPEQPCGTIKYRAILAVPQKLSFHFPWISVYEKWKVKVEVWAAMERQWIPIAGNRQQAYNSNFNLKDNMIYKQGAYIQSEHKTLENGKEWRKQNYCQTAIKQTVVIEGAWLPKTINKSTNFNADSFDLTRDP